MARGEKVYLGDGLYAEDDGFQIRLYTDRGGDVHEVYLDTHVLAELFSFIETVRGVKVTVSRFGRAD